MLKAIVASGLAGFALAGVLFAADRPVADEQRDNPYKASYTRNVSNMAQPDLSLDSVIAPDAAFSAESRVDPAQSSKTCSQRCSTTCTTTRGCKQQTDGCQGTTTTPTTAKPVISAPLTSGPVSGPQLSTDLTAWTTANAERALVASGYDGICVTGVIDPAFTAALKDFQLRKGLTATGTLNSGTWSALEVVLAKIR